MGLRQAKEPNELLRLLVDRVGAGDVDGIVELYEDDAVLDVGDGLATGSTEIREFWTTFVASGISVSLGRQAAPLINDDLALTSSVMPDGVVTAEIARRQPDGSWKWAVDQPSLPVRPT